MTRPAEKPPSVGSAYIRTFGCQMNEYDSERIAGLLSLAGYRQVDDPNVAEVIIINTCSIREKPEEKTYSEIGTYRAIKETKPGVVLAVCGCVAQQRGAEIIERFPYVDLVVGTNQIDRIDALIARVRQGRGPQVATEFSETPHITAFPRVSDRYTASVTVMQGCNNFCSYCIVPYVRGREISRRSEEIITEVRGLADEGFMEVMLLGQNVNSYRDPTSLLPFPMLLHEVAAVAGIKRIRFTTSHPKDLSPELIACYRGVDSLCSHIHLPVQSGSSRILELMNRGYTREGYLEKIRALRAARPDISVTTDIIVGFPGESAADFDYTLALMEEVKFDGAYSFKYSPRPGTKAAALRDDVDEVEKSRRLAVLQELQKGHTLSANEKSVNRVEEVLAVGPSVRDPGELTGRSRTNKVVNFTGGRESIGSLVGVRIKKANNNSLWGEAV